ncbi:MAG: hypothetical protein HYZ75_04105 [Elusimicrobia bacterium]|nr:hypothetical protein [Elusimicrobiota bacterium]
MRLPARQTYFGVSARALRCPTILFMLVSLPMYAGLIAVAGHRLFGEPGDTLRDAGWYAAIAVPGAAAWLLYLIGRLELIDVMPDASPIRVSEHPTLSLPDGGPADSLRPTATPPARRAPRHLRLEGVCFLIGLGCLVTAGALAAGGPLLASQIALALDLDFGNDALDGLAQTFTGLGLAGLASAAAGFWLLLRRVNRLED